VLVHVPEQLLIELLLAPNRERHDKQKGKPSRGLHVGLSTSRGVL
jgi:hypothetical protein